ncbi:MAG TPA: hypothetical protein VEU11_00840 [Terriglobales bacterium]|nr:hypothetical protein [Terriglobales bacterium]
MTRIRLTSLMLLVAASVAAALPALAMKKDESLDQLIARAESARLEDRPALYLEIARQKAEGVDKLYNAGNAEAGKTGLQDVVSFSRKATNTSIQTGKKMKNVEIGLRKMAEKFRDVKRTVAFEDQAPIQQTVDQLEQMRTDLLSAMFGKKNSQ